MKKVRGVIYIFIIILLTFSEVNAISLDTKKTLRYGSSGESVKNLQTMLNTVSNCNLPVTGNFYTKTKDCVKKYQKEHNLVIDGSVGPATSSSINETYSKLTNTTTTTATTTTTTNTNTKTFKQDYNNISKYVTLLSTTLNQGSKGDNVRLLQQELNKILPSCNLPVVGNYGPATTSCIKTVQRNNNLKETGNVDEYLMTIINHNYLDYQGIITKNNVNVRSYPNSKSNIVYTLNKGTVLYLNGYSNGWYYVSYGYGTAAGYVYKDNFSPTYIEVDINSQVLRYYKDGQLYLDTIITTGKNGTHNTPKGFYKIEYKSTNQYLKSSNVTVDYWMTFKSSGYGIHSAKSWRDNYIRNSLYEVYGGTIYKSNSTVGSRFSGSHGCVNTPINKMSVLYNEVSLNTPVIVY